MSRTDRYAFRRICMVPSTARGTGKGILITSPASGKTAGCPLILGEYDDDIKRIIWKLRYRPGTVPCHVNTKHGNAQRTDLPRGVFRTCTIRFTTVTMKLGRGAPARQDICCHCPGGYTVPAPSCGPPPHLTRVNYSPPIWFAGSTWTTTSCSPSIPSISLVRTVSAISCPLVTDISGSTEM